jgi:hypothetical protein
LLSVDDAAQIIFDESEEAEDRRDLSTDKREGKILGQLLRQHLAPHRPPSSRRFDGILDDRWFAGCTGFTVPFSGH